MRQIVNFLNRTPSLRFFASVQLAVPLLLLLACVVAYGTVIESRYNADYARLLVYDTFWFQSLLGLLGINIFLSTISRYPFQRRHIGFVVVHTGLLTLLAGSFLTRQYGVDGQLRVVEGGQDGTVVLPELSLQFTDLASQTSLEVPIARTHRHRGEEELKSINGYFNGRIVARELLPFAEVREGFEASTDVPANNIALGFMMKSAFFDVAEWLHSKERPEIKLGPATIRLRILNDGEKLIARSGAKKPRTRVAGGGSHAGSESGTGGKARLLVHDEASGAILSEFRLAQLKPGLQIAKGIVLAAMKVYRRAAVTDNRLVEGEQPNPAVELFLKSAGKSVREVAYARYPGFTLHQDRSQTFGLRFEYKDEAGGEETQVAGNAEAVAEGAGNLIEFLLTSGSDLVTVVLSKNGQEVLRQQVSAGETVKTPWMGMQLTLGSVKVGAAAKVEAIAVAVQEGRDLPPAAIRLSIPGEVKSEFWLGEGQARQLNLQGREYEVYFGRRSVELPFALELLQFQKIDYLGTETPMSFSSRVRMVGQEGETEISMNEPLKKDGYTLYQSSYDIRPGQPRASIFSVNRDPGRPVKYLGSLILALGIVIFNLMRSRVYRKFSAPERPAEV